MSPGCIRGRFCQPPWSTSVCLSWKLLSWLHTDAPLLISMTHSHVASSRPLFSLHALQDFLGLLTTLFLGATVSSEDAKGPHLLSSPTSSHTHLSMPTACPISPCSPASPPVLPVLLGLATLTLTLLLMSAQFSLPSFHQWKMGPSQGLSQNCFLLSYSWCTI